MHFQIKAKNADSVTFKKLVQEVSPWAERALKAKGANKATVETIISDFKALLDKMLETIRSQEKLRGAEKQETARREWDEKRRVKEEQEEADRKKQRDMMEGIILAIQDDGDDEESVVLGPSTDQAEIDQDIPALEEIPAAAPVRDPAGEANLESKEPLQYGETQDEYISRVGRASILEGSEQLEMGDEQFIRFAWRYYTGGIEKPSEKEREVMEANRDPIRAYLVKTDETLTAQELEIMGLDTTDDSGWDYSTEMIKQKFLDWFYNDQ
jgi:hypothetical protein